MKACPIMLLSDAPEQPTGLARITRDVAAGLSRMPEFRVATLGRGGRSSRRFPWTQYGFPVSAQWGEAYLEECWRDFSGGEPGILFTIWDATRLPWLVMFERLPEPLASFLSKVRMQRWGYFPIDGSGPGDRISLLPAETIRKFDRALAYGMWAQELMGRSTGRDDIDWLPHGLNTSVFSLRDQNAGRILLDVGSQKKVVGCVMTNQSRKDWGLAFEAMAGVVRERPDVVFWAHTDVLNRTWSLDALVADFSLMNNVRITMTGEFDDVGLAALYSACDLTILPSLGEGFGYPIVESLACGVPVIHGNYGGGAELVSSDHRVEPFAYRLETPYNVRRPVFRAIDWMVKILEVLDSDPNPEEYRRRIEHLDWKNLWPVWEKWLREGIA